MGELVGGGFQEWCVGRCEYLVRYELELGKGSWLNPGRVLQFLLLVRWSDPDTR